MTLAPVGPERSRAIRAARLYHAGGLTQAAVAKRLGVTSAKAHRLIARAVAERAVTVTVEVGSSIARRWRRRCATASGWTHARLRPTLPSWGCRFALGTAGARFLRREIERGEYRVIGLGHGRTLSAAVDQLPRIDAGGVRSVSLMGASRGTAPRTRMT